MNSKLVGAVFAILSLGVTLPAYAGAVTWADLSSDNGITDDPAGQVYGTIGSVGVTFSGDYEFDQLNNTGAINYWTDNTAHPVLDAPTANSDIIGLSDAGTDTITFSHTVQNVFIAFNSPFTIISQGCGYWGCGSFHVVNPTEFIGFGELVGVLEFHCNCTSFSFTDSVSENWHGIDIGTSAVPEPGTLALFGVALLGLGALGMRRKSA